jgi:hypothetical protein
MRASPGRADHDQPTDPCYFRNGPHTVSLDLSRPQIAETGGRDFPPSPNTLHIRAWPYRDTRGANSLMNPNEPLVDVFPFVAKL